MEDTSFLEDITAGRKQRRAKLKYYIAAIVLLAGLSSFGVVQALHGRPDQKVTTASTDASPQVESDTTPTPQAATTPAPTTPTPQPSTPAIVPATPAVDTTATDAKLCQSIIDNAKKQVQFWSDEYFKAWKQWNDNYYGRYDSPEALSSKQWYKDYIKQQINNVITTSDPTAHSACHSNVSLADIVVEPNYDAW